MPSDDHENCQFSHIKAVRTLFPMPVVGLKATQRHETTTTLLHGVLDRPGLPPTSRRAQVSLRVTEPCSKDARHVRQESHIIQAELDGDEF